MALNGAWNKRGLEFLAIFIDWSYYIHVESNLLLTLTRVEIFHTVATRRIEWHGPEPQMEPLNLKSI